MEAPPTLGEEIKSSGEITLHSATGVVNVPFFFHFIEIRN